jgi:hypothetical protein
VWQALFQERQSHTLEVEAADLTEQHQLAVPGAVVTELAMVLLVLLAEQTPAVVVELADIHRTVLEVLEVQE